MVLEQVDIQWQKKKTTDIISHHTQNLKVNQKIKELNLGDKTIKLLEQNTREYLHNFESDDDFLDMTPKAEATEK